MRAGVLGRCRIGLCLHLGTQLWREDRGSGEGTGRQRGAVFGELEVGRPLGITCVLRLEVSSAALYMLSYDIGAMLPANFHILCIALINVDSACARVSFDGIKLCWSPGGRMCLLKKAFSWNAR